MTNATDYPSTSKQQYGQVELGKGPALARGAGVHPVVFEGMVEAGEAEGIPSRWSRSAAPPRPIWTPCH